MSSRQIILLKHSVPVILAVLIGTYTAAGIHYDSFGALGIAILLLGLLNLFLKPLLMLFSLPFIILTLGLGIWLINALLFMLVAALVNGFYVESFASALWGALILSLTSLAMNFYFGDAKNNRSTININRSWRFSSQGLRTGENPASRPSKRNPARARRSP